MRHIIAILGRMSAGGAVITALIAVFVPAAFASGVAPAFADQSTSPGSGVAGMIDQPEMQYTGVLVGNAFLDTQNVTITCTAGMISGTAGSAGPSTITSSTLGPCTDMLDDSWTVTQAPGTVEELMSGQITGIDDEVSGFILGSECTFEVTGNGQYAFTGPGTQTDPADLQVTETDLTISNTSSGCSSSINGVLTVADGDSATFMADYAITYGPGGIRSTDPLSAGPVVG